MATTILLVEDDVNLAFMLIENLEIEGFNVVHLTRGEGVISSIKQNSIDVVLMDVDLEGNLDGFEVAENLRAIYPSMPIIFTTGKTHFKDMDRGFRLGNMDYQKKPYGAKELVSRINNLLSRKSSLPTPKVFTHRGFSFSPVDHIMIIDNKEIKLTKTEASFLRILCENMNTVVTKEDLAIHLWGKDDNYSKDHSLNNLSHRIRKNLEENLYIELVTISKVGYRLTEK